MKHTQTVTERISREYLIMLIKETEEQQRKLLVALEESRLRETIGNVRNSLPYLMLAHWRETAVRPVSLRSGVMHFRRRPL